MVQQFILCLLLFISIISGQQNVSISSLDLVAQFPGASPSAEIIFVNSSADVWWSDLNVLYAAEKDANNNWVTYWDLSTKTFNVSTSCGPATTWAALYNATCLNFLCVLPNSAVVEVIFAATNVSNAIVQPCGVNGSAANLTMGGFVIAMNVSDWPFANMNNTFEVGIGASGSFDGLDVGVAEYDSGGIEEVSAPTPFALGMYVHFWQCVQAMQANNSIVSLPLTIGTKVKKVFAPASVELHLRVPAFEKWMALLGPAVFLGTVIPVKNFWGWYVLAFALALVLCGVFGVLLWLANRHYSRMALEESAALQPGGQRPIPNTDA